MAAAGLVLLAGLAATEPTLAPSTEKAFVLITQKQVATALSSIGIAFIEVEELLAGLLVAQSHQVAQLIHWLGVALLQRQTLAVLRGVMELREQQVQLRQAVLAAHLAWVLAIINQLQTVGQAHLDQTMLDRAGRDRMVQLWEQRQQHLVLVAMAMLLTEQPETLVVRLERLYQAHQLQ